VVVAFGNNGNIHEKNKNTQMMLQRQRFISIVGANLVLGIYKLLGN
jgi:hypothetical protein